jgi:uncharacterized membrane protein
MLIGLIFLVPVGGLIIGAVMGALSGKLSDYGIDDKFARNVSEKLEPGKAALFLMIRKVTAEKVIPAMSKFGGEILTSNISPEAEARLQAALESGSAPAAPAAE